MATIYWSKKGAIPGTTKVGTESNPIDGPADLRAALGDGRCPAGSTIVFMGELGALTLTDSYADFPNTFATISQSLYVTTTIPTNAGIVFGNSNSTSSNAANRRFTARGDLTWHVDMRGASINAHRMIAALAFQGCNIEVDGWRIACADWNYIGNGSDRITPTSQDNSSNPYAAECSDENIGILVHGAWGSSIHDCKIWGSDAFSRTGLKVYWHSPANSSVTTWDEMTINIANIEAYGSYYGLFCNTNGYINSGNFIIPTSAKILIDNIYAHDSRWGDTSATPVKNNAMAHAGGIGVYGRAVRGGQIKLSRAEVSGWFQDGIELIAQNASVEDSYVHNVNPGYTYQQNFHYWVSSGSSWIDGTYPTVGDCIKTGLNGYDGATGAGWLVPGTPGGYWNIDQLRNRVLRCNIDGTGASYYGITTNGSGGTVVHGCEINNMGRAAILFSRNTIDTSYYQQSYASNNYLSGTHAGIMLSDRHTVYLYNNIINGNNYDIDCVYPSNNVLNGSHNRLIHNSIYLNSCTNNLTNTTTGAADYTVGVGPTLSGNCDNDGTSNAQILGRFYGVYQDLLLRNINESTPAVGPYNPSFPIRPNSDLYTTGWTSNTGGTLFDDIDETVENDSDYISTTDLAENTPPVVFGLDTAVTPGQYTFKIRAKCSYGRGELQGILYNSGDTIVGQSSWQLLEDIYSTYSLNINCTGTATKIGIKIRSNLPVGTLWLDDSPISLNNDPISFVEDIPGMVYLNNQIVELDSQILSLV